MENCTNCRYKQSLYTGIMDSNQSLDGYELVFSSDKFSGDFYVKCDGGHTARCVEWWKQNGNKPVDQTSDMDCYKPTKSAIMLGNMMDLLDEMSDKLDE